MIHKNYYNPKGHHNETTDTCSNTFAFH